MTPEPADDQVVVGVVTGAFGLNGDVKIELHTPSPERFSPGNQLLLDGQPTIVERMRAERNHLVIKLDLIPDRDKAESLGGHLLTIPEEKLNPLPDDQFYHFELLEMSVYSDDDVLLGAISEIITTPGNDVYVVQKTGFRDLLLPALASVVLDVDVTRKRMTVRLLEGLEQAEATISKRKRRAERRRANIAKATSVSETGTAQPNTNPGGLRMPIVSHSENEVPWRSNYRKWDITQSDDGTTSSSMAYSVIGVGAGAPLHTHEADELIVVLEGVLEVRINDEIHQVGPDHTIVVPPNVPHGFTIVGDSDARILGFFPIQDPFHHTHYLEGGPANQNEE